jgi:hypothetical protein
VSASQTEPSRDPDRLSLWPTEDGRYGLDATYQGSTGFKLAEDKRRELEQASICASIRQELQDGWTLRVGPVTHDAAWAVIEEFLGPRGSPRH